MLNILDKPVFDDRIVKIETHTYNPTNNNFGNSDEIRIPIQQQDLYILPCESFLYIEGKVTQKVNEADAEKPTLVNNCAAFLFEEIRYELNGVEIDRNRNAGITSTMKNYISLSEPEAKALEIAGWCPNGTQTEHFAFLVPLGTLLGSFADNRRIVVYGRHEIILIRSRNDRNCVKGKNVDPEFVLYKVQLKMPTLKLSELESLKILRIVETGIFLKIFFRKWEWLGNPLLQNTTKHSWTIKSATQVEKPRYVIFALQTGRTNKPSADASKFDHCNITNVRLYLNSEFYPYDDMNLDIAKNNYGVLYDMYTRFGKSYYGCGAKGALLSFSDFIKDAPITVIDCSRQNDSIKHSMVDIRLEFEFKDNVPSDTTAHVLLVSECEIEYCPQTNVVRKIM